MEITGIRVILVDEKKLRAYVDITIDGCFMVRGLKVINGLHGLFVSMPNKRSKNGVFRDVAHPINAATRAHIERVVMAEYQKVVGEG